jgi:IS30 family transposase
MRSGDLWQGVRLDQHDIAGLARQQVCSHPKEPGQAIKPLMESLINSLSPLPSNARRSITFDCGTEFNAWQHLKDGLGVEPWFFNPQSPWQ